jgi:hypothetical protein
MRLIRLARLIFGGSFVVGDALMGGSMDRDGARTQRSGSGSLCGMSFFQALWSSPSSTPLSRYTTWNGLFYLAFGLLTYVWPGSLQVVLGAAPFQAREEGLARIVGALVMIIGWFYVRGARTRADSFSLATVVDRALVPLLLVPLVVIGAVDPRIGLPFAILDPLLAIGAYVIWRRSR